MGMLIQTSLQKNRDAQEYKIAQSCKSCTQNAQVHRALSLLLPHSKINPARQR